jgi:hypothetical protein
MIRVAIVAAVLAGALSSAGGAAVAGADPGDPVLCNFTMSDPYVIDLSGTQMVTATLTPTACTGSAIPSYSQVCLSTPGTAGRCAELPGYTDVHVYLGPYQPGVTYTAKGRGCASQTTPPAPVCTTVGPKTATL